MTETSNQRAPRFVKNPSGYHSHGKTHKEKIYNFGVHIKQFGWTGSWTQDPESMILKATMSRGEGEKIEIEWPETQWWPDVWYTFGGESQKCRNISAAAKLAAAKPDANKLRRSSGKGKGGKGSRIAAAYAAATSNSDSTAEELIAELSTSLPFDRESTPDEIKVVIKQHRNPTIIWVNRISGEVCQDIIKTWSRHLRVTQNKEGKTIIHFVGQNCFHAVYVDCVIGVS